MIPSLTEVVSSPEQALHLNSSYQMASLKTRCIILRNTSIFFSHQYLPVSVAQVDFIKIPVSSQSLKQIFCSNYRLRIGNSAFVQLTVIVADTVRSILLDDHHRRYIRRVRFSNDCLIVFLISPFSSSRTA